MYRENFAEPVDIATHSILRQNCGPTLRSHSLCLFDIPFRRDG